MEFEDVDSKFYFIFLEKFACSHVNSWKSFIETLDLGVHYMHSYSDDTSKITKSIHVGNIDIYKIIDEKKWLLSKIKYGF